MTAKIEGITREPITNPDTMLNIIQQKFPDIVGWHIQFSDIATTLLNVDDHGLIGHKIAQPCQLKALGHGDKCERASDFILVSVIFTKGSERELDLDDANNNIVPTNSRIRYYCAPCLYTTMNRAIGAISRADGPSGLEDAFTGELSESCSKVLQQRALFAENAINRSAQVIEDKYPENGDALIDEARKKFSGGGS